MLQKFKQFVYDWLNKGFQFENQPEFEAKIQNAQSFDDIKNAIDEWWGWEDEQTVDMLEYFIKEVCLT